MDTQSIHLRRRRSVLRSAHLNDTSCVIADLQMPAISGLDLLTHMRTEGYNAPFIFITAFPDGGQLIARRCLTRAISNAYQLSRRRWRRRHFPTSLSPLSPSRI